MSTLLGCNHASHETLFGPFFGRILIYGLSVRNLVPIRRRAGVEKKIGQDNGGHLR